MISIMEALVLAWIAVSSIWTMFCILDLLASWNRYRNWRATVIRCERESVVLLFLLVDEIGKARERMSGNSGPCDVIPYVDKPQTE